MNLETVNKGGRRASPSNEEAEGSDNDCVCHATRVSNDSTIQGKRDYQKETRREFLEPEDLEITGTTSEWKQRIGEKERFFLAA